MLSIMPLTQGISMCQERVPSIRMVTIDLWSQVANNCYLEVIAI
jgi:hypothetical protein